MNGLQMCVCVKSEDRCMRARVPAMCARLCVGSPTTLCQPGTRHRRVNHDHVVDPTVRHNCNQHRGNAAKGREIRASRVGIDHGERTTKIVQRSAAG